MIERTNQEWLAALRGPGRDEALGDLRALLVRGLGYALAGRPGVDGFDSGRLCTRCSSTTLRYR
ncbi:MAG: hypothetical protein OEW09_06485 [Anaerolineae bacterium]|nr:hypothetical protein [Anaerolineae bacterium]